LGFGFVVFFFWLGGCGWCLGGGGGGLGVRGLGFLVGGFGVQVWGFGQHHLPGGEALEAGR